MEVLDSDGLAGLGGAVGAESVLDNHLSMDSIHNLLKISVNHQLYEFIFVLYLTELWYLCIFFNNLISFCNEIFYESIAKKAATTV